jgi:hypothetical protein
MERRMPSEATYPPLNVPKPVADGVWIVDAEPVHAGGLPLPLRMSIIRLASGDLLLHSPTPYTPGLRRRIEELGPIRHLIAPSVGHWMFLRDWQRACANATTWAVPGLRERSQVRRAGVRIDAVLGDTAPDIWAGEIDQVLVQAPVFKEVDLFHRPSRTLLLTDLVLNLENDRLPVLARPLAHLLGIVAPRGKAPIYVRLLLRANQREVMQAAARLIAFQPKRVIFSHGGWFEDDATEKLRRSLAWILPPAPIRSTDRERVAPASPGARNGLLAAAALAATVGVATYLARRKAASVAAGRPNEDLRRNAEKALRMRKAAGPQTRIPAHRTAHQGGVQGPQIGYSDTALGKEATYTSNLKRSHNARTGDA